MKKFIILAILALCVLPAFAKIHTLQVTLGAGNTPIIPNGDIVFKWVAFQNNSAHTMRIGDTLITSSRGIVLLAGTSGGGGSLMQQPWSTPQGGSLAAWYVNGTSGDVLDVIYDDGNL